MRDGRRLQAARYQTGTPGSVEVPAEGFRRRPNCNCQIPARGSCGPSLLLKDPYVFDFPGLTDSFLERDLEDAILRELETFLLHRFLPLALTAI